ncbi:acyltransferase family protein, partial [Streptomyces sp. 4N509B]
GWLRSRLMVWLGTVSFAFYMVQAVIIFYGRPEILETRTYATLPALVLLAALFLANLLAAWLLYRLVELPVMRRWSRPRTTTTQPTTTQPTTDTNKAPTVPA